MITKHRTARLAAVAAFGALTFAVAAPAQAAPVTHDGCTISAQTPAFTNHWSPSGLKQVDYVYTLTCLPSAAGVSVEVDAERWEQDLLGRAGDPDAPDDFTGESTQTLSFAAAGGIKTVTIRANLPVTDDTDGSQEMYLNAGFRVTSGAVTGTWSARSLSAAQRIFN